MKENILKKPSVLQALISLLFINIVVYLIARSIFLYYAEYGTFEKILTVLFFLAEAFVMLHAFGYFVSIYRLNKRRGPELKPAELKAHPPVAILIPARHEPKEVLEETLVSCYNLAYPHKMVYLLDDSSEERYKKEAEELTEKYGARVFRRTERHGAKAGIINDCLKTLSEKYVAIFDADQNPMPEFFSKVIPILESDPKLAFVQTPQFYSNLEASKISFASNMQQAIFYEYVCEGKGSTEAMMCCGTNVVLRREALLDVGGLDETTVTEDFATSLKMHMKGWKSLYYNHVHTFGMGPEDLGSYFKQQNRWAMGNVGVFKKVLKNLLIHPFALKPSQWFEYFITGTYYMIGWAYLFLICCPIMYVFFNVPSFFIDPVVYTLTFVPYFVLSLSLYYSTMMGRHYSAKDLYKGQLLAFITMPIYMRASFSGFIGVKGTFQVTAKGGVKRLAYFKLWPQIISWALCLSAVAWGLNRFLYERTIGIAINVFWIGYHFLLLSGIFYFNEEETLYEACKKLKKGVIFEYNILEEKRAFEQLGKDARKRCFSVFLPEKLEAGKIVMCKLNERGKEPMIFDGSVFWSSENKSRKGFETIIAPVTISEKDRNALREALR